MNGFEKYVMEGVNEVKRYAVNEDGREEAAREQESRSGHAVNEFVVVKSGDEIHAYPGDCGISFYDDVLHITEIDGDVASVTSYFRDWKYCRRIDGQTLEELRLSMMSKVNLDGSITEPEPQKQWMPRRANLQQG